jgi:hypothetical protein
MDKRGEKTLGENEKEKIADGIYGPFRVGGGCMATE